MMNLEDLNAIESESGIIATLIHHPEFSFYSEHLLPNHFTSNENKCLYAAICELAKKDIQNIDAYNIIEVMATNEAMKKIGNNISVDQVQEMIEVSKNISRDTLNEYKMLVSNVLDIAFRRDTLRRLKECEAMCFNTDIKDVEQHIYKELDDVMLEFSGTTYIPQMKDVIDDLWDEIEARQDGKNCGMPFKFPTLNQYVTIEPGELIVVGALMKTGKSMFLLNCAVELLKRDKSIFYIDSELNSRLFTTRLISHLSQVEFSKIKSGTYSSEEKARIDDAVAWIKTKKFFHLYMPFFDPQAIYTSVKKVDHLIDLDCLIIDYFKSGDSSDAYTNYTQLGRLVDMVKNEICGDLSIAGLAAAQAKGSGNSLADSAKIARNASTILMLQDKTPEEIEEDGIECGNRKLIVSLNRNGMQHAPGEYIDLQFTGNIISFEEAKQHIPVDPY